MGHAGFTQISYARWRNGCTFTRGAWHTGHTPFSPSMACTRPLGTGYVTSQSGQPMQPMKLEWFFAEVFMTRSLPHLGQTPTFASAVTASAIASPRSSLCSMSGPTMLARSAREWSTTSVWVSSPRATSVMSLSSSAVMSGLVMCGAYSVSASMTAMPSWLGSTGSFFRYFTSYRRWMMLARVDLVPRLHFSISWIRRPWL